MSVSREDRIRQRAHEIWLREGQPDGHSGRHWIEAEGEIDAEDKPAPKPAARKPAAAKPKATPIKPKAAATTPKKPAAKPAKKPAK